MRRKHTPVFAATSFLLAITFFTAGGHPARAMAQKHDAKPAESSAPAKPAAPQSTGGSSETIINTADMSADSLTAADVTRAMTLHKLGKDDAPVKMTEFASLSCPHCAEFYKVTFPQIKKDYIDTGKVQYTFVDFPLNGPALNAASIALCMPEESYFRYIDYLFQTQEQWALSDKQNTMLIQNGKLLGADGDKLQKCVDSKKLKAAIVDRMQKEGQAFGVEATPTFVFNNNKATTIPGALPYADFKKALDKLLTDKGLSAVGKPVQ